MKSYGQVRQGQEERRQRHGDWDKGTVKQKKTKTKKNIRKYRYIKRSVFSLSEQLENASRIGVEG